MHLMLYVLILTILIAETTAISFLKEYRVTGLLPYFVVGYLGYVGVCLLLVQTFRYEGMGMVNVLWSAFSVLSVVLVGHFCFKEPVTRKEIVGICFVLVGVTVLRVV